MEATEIENNHKRNDTKATSEGTNETPAERNVGVQHKRRETIPYFMQG